MNIIGFPEIIIGFPEIIIGFPEIIIGFPMNIIGFPRIYFGLSLRNKGLYKNKKDFSSLFFHNPSLLKNVTIF